MYQGPKGRQLIATPARAWDRCHLKRSAEGAAVFIPYRKLSHLRRSTPDVASLVHALTGVAIRSVRVADEGK